MQLYKKPRDLMTQDGKGILRSLQNESLPYIDLIVRESLQNSLDATLKSKKITDVNIDINDFNTAKVSEHFEGIQDKLVSNYSETETALIIKDKNTSGLNGTIDFSELTKDADIRKSKFYKLVYGLSMNQDERGAGGSWGLGKTSYFRIGNGLVIYYTRVKDELTGKYQSRLAASLIEDPNSPNALLESSLGLAWWGKTTYSSANTLPITDESKINEFIEHFNITPYQNEETGTTIIIPFLNKEKLISNSTQQTLSKLRKEFILAIQRWYYPRILNDEYTEYVDNSKLDIKVNGNQVDIASFPKTFKIFRNLYNSAISGVPVEKEIQVNDIKGLQNVLDNPKKSLGRVAFITLSFSKLEIIGQDRDLTPLEYVGLSKPDVNNSEGQGILAYMRKPGMVVEYVNTPTPWMKKVNIPDNYYLLAVFVPISGEKLKRSKYVSENYNYEFLEDYLRDTENADHATWIDKTIGTDKFTIVKRLQEYVAREIKQYTDKNDDKQISSKTSEMSRQLGKRFLPPIGYGKAGSTKGNKNTITDSNKNTKSDYIDITGINRESATTITISTKIGLIVGTSLISIEIATQEGLMDINKWNKQLDSRIKYPFKLKNIEIYNDKLEELVIINQIDESSFEIVNSANNFELYSGKISFEINDLNMQPSLQVRSIKGADKQNG